ncbi:putative Dihydrouridine synthase (Dus) [Trypanosoma vivax]|nr:putative tRNA-dihydrouridine synthase 4 [Trypanosoma vivax]KAH8607351.1 putative Dihydrouridine synthase (Dus) [Trypanosoma vivax]
MDLPVYERSDLVAMLREAQTATIRFSAEHKGMLSDFSISKPAEHALYEHRVMSVYNSLVKLQAPMVRCSRPAFRKLCQLWGTDVSYTHMIMAESFSCSEAARQAEFSIYAGEKRLVTQLASSSGPTAAAAAALVASWCDAIDINCGCPQRWVMAEGLGAALLGRPEVVADTVRCVRNALGSGVELPCVVKMRVTDDIRRSVDFARQCEAAGAAWVTVHGRTPNCTPHATVKLDDIRVIRESLGIPVVANGGIDSPKTALQVALATGVGGVMSATGLLSNPACFYVQKHGEKLHLTPRRYDQVYGHREKEHTCSESVYTSARTCKERPTAEKGAEGDWGTVWPPGVPHCPVEVISDFIRLSCVTNLGAKATTMHLLKMAWNYLSPLERTFVAEMRSSFSVISAFQQLGLYVDEGKFPFPAKVPK